MIDWHARARAKLAQQHLHGADETDETQLLSVLSVPLGGLAQQRGCLSSVSSVAAPAAATVGTEVDCMASTMAANDQHAGTPPSLVRDSGNPYMTPDQGDECHACGWVDVEIETFLIRAARFALIGRTDAEHLAERLTLRDRQADDRRMCVECRELDSNGRCAAARRGALPGIDGRQEPVQNILIRCSAFKVTVSAHRFNEGQ